MSEQSDRKLAAAHRVVAAEKCFIPFNDKDHCWVHPATLKAMKQAEHAFANDDYDRAEHLAEVVLCMMRRDTAKFQANPEAWIANAKMREATNHD
jgi:hypothetical protein